MLGFYMRLARRLHRVRLGLWALLVLCLAGFAAAVRFAGAGSSEGYMLLSICLLLWAMGLLAVAHTFIHPLPGIGTHDGFLARVRIRLAGGLRVVMAWTMTGLFLVVLVVSLRAGALAVRALA